MSALSSVGCGTLLYPERRGQRGGRIDWKVVALDGAGLLLFFIPGVIAFAVDIMTGAIYLPPEHYGQSPPAPTMPTSDFIKLPLPADQVNPTGIAQVVATHTGKQINLEQDDYFTCRIDTLDQFSGAAQKLARTAQS